MKVRDENKALDEIYKIYRLLHRSDPKISAKSCPKKFKMNLMQSYADVYLDLQKLCHILRTNSRIFRKCLISEITTSSIHFQNE